MDLSRRFLNNSGVSQHIRTLTFTMLIFTMACAPSGGGSGGGQTHDSPLSGSPIVCGLEASSTSEESVASGPYIHISENFDSYIVEFEDDSRGIPPSGNPLYEYVVAGVTLKPLSHTTYTFEMSGSKRDKEETIERLAQNRTIKVVEPDYPVHSIHQEEIIEAQDTKNMDDMDLIDQDAVSQWAHTNTKIPAAWTTTKGSRDIVVAVVDSGIDYGHTDLKDNAWINPGEILNGKDDDGNGYIDDIYGWNFVSNNNNPKTTSSSNHGSHVAGIIGATGRNKSGVFGAAQNVRLMALRFIGNSGSGNTSNAIKAIDYAVKKKVFAINNSWGSPYKSQALQNAITRAEKAGVLFVVAAGNGSGGKGYNISTTPYYPAAYTHSNILRVAASKTDNNLTAFSNYSKSLVDVAAPGQNIISTVTGNKYTRMSGTSMATPLVTGIAVLVKAANRALNYSQIKAIISASVDKTSVLNSKIKSGGRVNAKKAVEMAAQMSSRNACP